MFEIFHRTNPNKCSEEVSLQICRILWICYTGRNKKMLSYIQIILAILLGTLVLIQNSEASLGAAFGGDGMDSSSRTRRGPELFIFRGTIVVACLFVASAFLNLLY